MKDFTIDVLNLLFFTYSRAAGILSKIYLPSPVNEKLLSLYVKKFNVIIGDAEHELKDYHSLYDFFTRRLKEGIRNFSPNPRVVISPCDAVIRDTGSIKESKLIQAKKYTYSLASLIGAEFSPIFHNGLYVTHYLRP
jgi:phosphatidylserine decarboxylase